MSDAYHLSPSLINSSSHCLHSNLILSYKLDRALSSVTRKLDKSLSVEYTVNQLIAEATDLVNLALMFVGK